jgi:tryptophan synthase alpha chain
MAALIPYLMAGFPDPRATVEIGNACISAGADLIELGIPSRHAPADGPAVRDAALTALSAGAGPDTVLAIARELSERAPVVLMTYARALAELGGPQFVHRAARAGVCGLMVPDLVGLVVDPAARTLRSGTLRACDADDLGFGPLVRPDSSNAALARAAQIATGFVYLASVQGKTGERSTVASGLREAIGRVRRHAEAPVVVGFGISAPWQARVVAAAGADGVVIGSRLIRAASDALRRDADPAAAVGSVVAALADGLSAAPGALGDGELACV